jgi:uncharacterized protein
MYLQEFFQAIEKGDKMRVHALLEAHPELARARNQKDVSALLFARYCGKLDLVDAILALVPEPDLFECAALGKRNRLAELVANDLSLVKVYSSDGFTALHFACFFGHPNVAEFLLRYGADANARSKNDTAVMPLHSATANVLKLKTVEWLLEYGADPNATQPGGWTPLHSAAVHGNQEMVEVLVSKGANPTRKNDKGQTPADLAREKDHRQVMAALKAHA